LQTKNSYHSYVEKHIYADSVIYIGKEANNIDEQALDVKKAQEFVNKQEIMDSIL